MQPGYYIYVGSAFGPGGFTYVWDDTCVRRRNCAGTSIICASLRSGRVWWTCDPVRRECEWASKLRELPGAVVPMAGFGWSDCGCESHLVWVNTTVEFGKGMKYTRYPIRSFPNSLLLKSDYAAINSGRGGVCGLSERFTARKSLTGGVVSTARTACQRSSDR